MLFRRQYLTELPLPIAQLYRRTNDEKSDEARHNVCYFIFESLVKLIAAPAVALYLEEAERDPRARVEKLDKQLQSLACPSQGHWVGILRELARHFKRRPDADVHPLGHLWDELEARRIGGFEDLIELYRAIKDGPDSTPSGDQSCSLREVIDALVPYRNLVLGHGAQQSRSFYEQKAPLFAPAVNDALQQELIGQLWPADARLIYVEELRTVDVDSVEMEYKDLTGERGVRMPARKLAKAQADRVVVRRVALDWPGREVPLRLDPLLTYHDSEQLDEVLFLNKDVQGRRVEHLSYTTGKTHKDKDEIAAEMRNLLGRVTGETVSPSEHDRLIEQSQSGLPMQEFVPHQPPTGRVIDDFEILVTLGKGGMGVVYLARQLSLGRLVALKMLPASLAGNEVYLARFQREIRILGQCEHPNIIKILAHGVTDDQGPYYVMEYVPGCDLNELVSAVAKESERPITSLTSGSFSAAVYHASQRKRENAGVESRSPTTKPISDGDSNRSADALVDSPRAQEVASLGLPPLPSPSTAAVESGGYIAKVARIVRDAARALQHIHEREVIHRDIKPANLMLTPDASRVVLMDFGLARLADSDITQELQRNRIGTLRYMAPEQLQVREIDERVDVHALGVTLWELLARQEVFASIEEDEQLRAAILDQDLPGLRTIDTSIPKDLEAIVSKATERKPSDRIDSAWQLAEYLDDFIEGRELKIRPRSNVERLTRWASENRTEFGLAASLAAVIIAALCTTSFLWQRERVARRAAVEAEQETSRALAAETEALRLETLARQRETTAKERAIAAEKKARAAVNGLLVEVSENHLLNQPGLKPLRDKLLNKATGFFNEFLATPMPRRDLLLDIGKTHYFIGVVTKDLESSQAAMRHYSKALEALETLAAGEERDLFRSLVFNRLGEAIQESADVSRDAAETFLRNKDEENAKAHYDATLDLVQQSKTYFERARAIREQLSDSPGGPEYDRLLANSLMNLGQLAKDELELRVSSATTSQLTELLPSLENEFSRVQERLFAKAQTIRGEQIDALETRQRDLKRQLDALGDADVEQRKSLANALRDATESRRKLRRDRALGDLNLGELYLGWGTMRVKAESGADREKYTKMRQHAVTAADEFEALRVGNGADTELRFLTAMAYQQLGNATIELREWSPRPFNAAAGILEQLEQQNPSELMYKRELIRVHADLGALYHQRQMHMHALHHYEIANSYLDPLVKDRYQNIWQNVSETTNQLRADAAARIGYADYLRELAQREVNIGEDPAARRHIHDCLEHYDQLVGITANDSIKSRIENLMPFIDYSLERFKDERYADLKTRATQVLDRVQASPR